MHMVLYLCVCMVYSPHVIHAWSSCGFSLDLNEKLIILFALHELPEHPNTSILCMFLLLVHCTIVSSVQGPTTLQHLLLLV